MSVIHRIHTSIIRAASSSTAVARVYRSACSFQFLTTMCLPPQISYATTSHLISLPKAGPSFLTMGTIFFYCRLSTVSYPLHMAPTRPIRAYAHVSVHNTLIRLQTIFLTLRAPVFIPECKMISPCSIDRSTITIIYKDTGRTTLKNMLTA